MKYRFCKEKIIEGLLGNGWSQADLAHASGFHQSQISKILSGKNNSMSLKNINRISRALGLSPFDVLVNN